MKDLKYPIGKYIPPQIITVAHLEEWIDKLTVLPQEIEEITGGLSDGALLVPYRPGGWTVKQVINHLADSHMNAYIRVHLILTEENPTIRPYFEDRWAKLVDGETGDTQVSIAILKAIHTRLVFLLKSLKPEDFERTYFHPEVQQQFTLSYLVGNYAWHGKHHLAHIQSTLK